MDVITKGTNIIIRKGGTLIYGTVLTAANWGRADKPNWYIEYTIDEKRSMRPSNFVGSYGYWKQGEDGGAVEIETETMRRQRNGRN
jgi:hypothetical protein